MKTRLLGKSGLEVSEENRKVNLALVEMIKNMAQEKQTSPARIALK